MIKINKYRTDATEFAFDGCHKFYLIENEQARKEMEENGYDFYKIEELERMFNDCDCSLKFINSMTGFPIDNDNILSIVEQFCSKVNFNYDDEVKCNHCRRLLFRHSEDFEYEIDYSCDECGNLVCSNCIDITMENGFKKHLCLSCKNKETFICEVCGKEEKKDDGIIWHCDDCGRKMCRDCINHNDNSVLCNDCQNEVAE